MNIFTCHILVEKGIAQIMIMGTVFIMIPLTIEMKIT